LAEDLTKKVSVLSRLLATLASGVLGWWITGYALTSVGIVGLDEVLAWWPASVAFTALAVGGMANAVNIIDGLNGLASGFLILAFIGLGLIATSVGDESLAMACGVMGAAVMGFWWLNWPWGKIFLGDGGSYLAGFAVAWMSVLLIERNASVTAFCPLLICIHPITEVLFSIFRRCTSQVSPSHADRLHLHSLMMRRVVGPWMNRFGFGHSQRADTLRNPVTGMLLAMLSLLPVGLAYLTSDRAWWAALSCAVFVLCYVTLYARLIRFHWCSPIQFLWIKPN
jgi:UDP-N-acetylmuramyl pentapeptide phosphotransferase/UDP-N-acetylglucosamine-1-phosphate transferase